MADPADRIDHASARRRRTPRFVLPDDRHDERTAARIAAFVEGSSARSRRHGAIDDRDRPRRPHELDTRPDWNAALQHESARHARYGRPAAVLLLELQAGSDAASIDRAARGLGEVIRVDVRETDRAARVGPMSYRLLLAETSARAARHVAARLDRAFQDGDRREDRPGWPQTKLRIEIAAPARGESLEDALIAAERRLA